MKRSYCLVICLMTIVGCHKKELKNDLKSLQQKKVEYEQLLAQHSEIPDPQVGFEVESVTLNSIDNQSIEIIYKPIKKNKADYQQVKASCIADMEMLGWECIGEFDGTNTQLIFQKAGKKLLSTIQIESNLQIKIIVYTKK